MKTFGIIEKAFLTLLGLLGLFLSIQIIRKILGGSWTTEDVILGLIILNLGSIFTLGVMVAQLKSDHEHLKGQFGSLANDFKSFMSRK